MNIKKSSRSAGKVLHGLLGDMGRMVIQDDTDVGFGRIVSIHLFEQRDELTTAMSVMNLTNYMTIMQIQSRQNRQGPQTLVFIVPHHSGLLPRFRHDIRCNILDGLYPRFLIHRYRNNRWSVTRFSGFVLKIDLLVYAQDLRHFLLKFRIAPLLIIGHFMRTQRMLIKDSLNGRLPRFLQTIMPRFRGIFPCMIGQTASCPHLRSIAILCRFLASKIDDPSLRFFRNHWLLGPMILVFQPLFDPQSQGFIYPFVNRRSADVDL